RELAVAAVLVLWALFNIGGIFDHRRWALPSELVRLPVSAALVAEQLPLGPWRLPALAALALLVIALALFLLAFRRQFDGAPPASDRIDRSSPLSADVADINRAIAPATIPPASRPSSHPTIAS